MIYTAQSQSLAALEMLVHLDSPEILKKYLLFEIELDAAYIADLDKSNFPKNWKADPVPEKVQAIGDAWIAAGSSAVLRVPSTLVPGESNFLLNPRHADFQKLTIHKPISFQFDPRFAIKR
jgi:RES domain-containing protein